MTKEHEFIVGAITALLIVALSFSQVLGLSTETVGAFLTLIGGSSGWLFRGRINGATPK